jgi:predicted nucleic acid-binding protein
MDRFVSPLDDSVGFAPRLASLEGVTIGLLDIAKPRGQEFLDRLAALLAERHGVGEVVRLRKPTFTRVAPDEVIHEASRCGAVVEALAD